MSGQKTEPPTPKKIEDSRKEGQVAKSQDLTSAFVLLTAATVLYIGGSFYMEKLQEVMRSFFQPQLLTGDLPTDILLRLLGQAGIRLLLLSVPLLVAIMVIAGLVMFLQVKPLFAPKAIKPKLDKINPVKGFKNKFFKPQTYLELLKNIVKFTLCAILSYLVIRDAIRDILLTATRSVLDSAQLTSELLFGFLFKISIAFLAIGVADFFLQQKLHLKELKMSKYEVKKEAKESEGDPLLKQARQEIHQEVLSSNMMQDVAKADVVVVNPTHIAVAIQYDEENMYAPEIKAKGQNLIAQKIVKVAKENGVPVMRNVPLAQSLISLELGSQIPEDLYEAVAEVLNWVYMLAQKEGRIP